MVLKQGVTYMNYISKISLWHPMWGTTNSNKWEQERSKYMIFEMTKDCIFVLFCFWF